ncbi:MAG: autotransporter-associated beta strand repeat-containing protein [Anaerolineae bacterium]|nr:autotransporter-associated beta strand repeat-containing protein [Phycisphaerae bacterium]
MQQQICSRKVRSVKAIVVAAAAAMSFSTSHWAQGLTTTFTNANNNLLWGDAGNWTNGVPGFFDIARFASPPPGLVDLGGVQRQLSAVQLTGSGYQIGNGTLALSNFLNADGVTSISGDLTRATAGELVVSGPNLTIAGTIFGSMDVSATGIFTGTNTYTGRTKTVFTLNLPNAGSSAASSRWDVQNGSLTLSYGAAGQVDKIGDTAPITLWRGALNIHNGSGATVAENVGTITLFKSANTIKLSTTDGVGGTLNLGTPSIIRQDFATALIDVNPNDGTTLKPAGTIGGVHVGGPNVIYPWMMGFIGPTESANDGPLSFITVSDSRGLRPLDFPEYASSIDGTNSDTRLIATQTLNGGTTLVRSLAMHGADAGVQLNNANLGISQGALALSADASATGEILSVSGTGTLATTANEIVIWTDAIGANTHRYRIDVPIQASQLTKAGPGTLVLSQPNTINGPVYISDGTLIAAASGALGGADATLVMQRDAKVRFENTSQSYGELFFDASIVEPQVSGFRLLAGAVTVDVADGVVATFDHVKGRASLNKVGAGRLHFTGDSATFGMPILLVEGSLQVDGTLRSIPQPPTTTALSISVLGNPGTKVLGNGTILGSVNAPIAPGADAPGRLTVSQLGFAPGSPAIEFELAGTNAGVNYDQLVVLESNTLTGRLLAVDLLNGFTPALGTQFTILDDRFSGAVTGAFNGLPQNTVFLADGLAFQISYFGGDGNDVVLTAVIPEPSSLIFVFAPLAAIAFSGSRRRSVC